MEIQAKKFKNRADLETAIKNLIGNDAMPKPEHVIKGKRSELEDLHLTDRSSVFGIKCVITDTPSEPKKDGKVKEIRTSFPFFISHIQSGKTADILIYKKIPCKPASFMHKLMNVPWNCN